LKLSPEQVATLAFDDASTRLDGVALAAEPLRASTHAITGELRFREVPPNDPQRYPMTRGRDVLRRQILGETAR
jgi:hypothetical protein